ncbi:TPA: hypothetical protein VDT37_001801 [Pseudomonas aeruginosa]|nr:hypothetical protein [Pseudomonas aeruginosa]
MLIDLLHPLSPGRPGAKDGVPADAVVTDEGEPEATDDGALVRFELPAEPEV